MCYKHGMKKILSLITLAVHIGMLILIIPLRTNAEDTLAQLIITEVASTVISDDEWIEIYNYGTESVHIAELTFYENESNHGMSSFSGETEIASHTSAIIANKADIFKSKNSTYSGILIDSTWASLREDGESIGLKVQGVFVDQVTYGASAKEQISERKSLQPNDWTTATPTLGVLSETQKIFLIPTETTTSATVIDEPIATSTESITNTESTTPTDSVEPLVELTLESIPATAATSSDSTDGLTLTSDAATSSAAATTDTSASSTATSTTSTNTTSSLTSTTQNTQISTNAPPVARITIQSGQLNATEKTSINFDGRTSYDPNNDQLFYDWNFGDGTNATSANPPIHTYSKTGVFTVQLSVTDTTGLKGVAYSTVNILAKSTSATNTATTSSSPASKTTSSTNTNVAAIETTGPTESTTTNPNSSEKITITVTAEQAKALFNTYSSASTSHNKTVSAASTESQPRGIVINELFPAPEKGENEWIELHNTEKVAVNLSGMLLADSSKLKKPFTLPAGSVIPPHGFAIITSEQSKISLNNGEDSVYLASATGTLIDSVTYSGGKKNLTYARAQDGEKTVWSWTSDITRGKENPSLSEIAGTVTNVGTKKQNGKESPYIEIQTTDNELHTVMTDDADKNADITNGFFNTGDTVSIAAFEAADGTEHLSSVKKIEAAPNSTSSNTTESSFTKTQLIIAAAVFLALNALTIMYFVRGFGPRQSGSESDEDLLA